MKDGRQSVLRAVSSAVLDVVGWLAPLATPKLGGLELGIRSQ